MRFHVTLQQYGWFWPTRHMLIFFTFLVEFLFRSCIINNVYCLCADGTNLRLYI